MIVPFEKLPETSRIWIYQADRAFTADEVRSVKEALDAFLSQWTAHGADLYAGYLMPYDRFIVIGLDQGAHAASGCSIDASVHFIQQLEARFGVVLLDRMNVTFKQGDQIAPIALPATTKPTYRSWAAGVAAISPRARTA